MQRDVLMLQNGRSPVSGGSGYSVFVILHHNWILGKNKMILLLILVFSIGCAGCTEKNPAAEQGELVKNERLSEQFGSLSRC